jgi:hypothetical protein
MDSSFVFAFLWGLGIDALGADVNSLMFVILLTEFGSVLGVLLAMVGVVFLLTTIFVVVFLIASFLEPLIVNQHKCNSLLHLSTGLLWDSSPLEMFLGKVVVDQHPPYDVDEDTVLGMRVTHTFSREAVPPLPDWRR